MDENNNLIDRFYDNSLLLDVTLEIDEFFEDIACLYVYPNWFKGQLVAGPEVKKYWISVILRYEKGDIPDPEGAKVLSKLGCKVLYKKAKIKKAVKVESGTDLGPRNKPKLEDSYCWLVKVTIPKHFTTQEKIKSLEDASDLIDIESVEQTLEDGNDDSSKELS